MYFDCVILRNIMNGTYNIKMATKAKTYKKMAADTAARSRVAGGLAGRAVGGSPRASNRDAVALCN